MARTGKEFHFELEKNTVAAQGRAAHLRSKCEAPNRKEFRKFRQRFGADSGEMQGRISTD